MYTAQPLPYYPTLSSPTTTQPSNSVPSQRSSSESTADTSLLSDFTSDPDGGAGGKSWGHLDLSLGLGASLNRNGWTSNDEENEGQFRAEEAESHGDPYQANANWSTFADDLIVVDEDETEVEGEIERQEDEATNQPTASSHRFSSFRDSRFHGSQQTDLLVDITPPFSSSTPPPPSHHPFPSSRSVQTGRETAGSSQKNPGGRPSLQTLLNSIEDRTLQLHQESFSNTSRSHRSSSRPSQYSDVTNQTPLVSQVRPNQSELTASAPRASSAAVQRLKEAVNRAKSTRESSPILNEQSSVQQMKPAQKRESRSRTAVKNWLEETSAELSPSARSNSQEDELAEKPLQSPRTKPVPSFSHVQTPKDIPSATPSSRRINIHPSFSQHSTRLSDHHPHSLEEVLKEEDELAEESSSASSEQHSPPTPPPRLPPHFSRRSPSSFVVVPPSSPPSPPPRIILPTASTSIKKLREHRQSPQLRSEHLMPAQSSLPLMVGTPIKNTASIRDIQTPVAPGGWGRTTFQTKIDRMNQNDSKTRGASRIEELKMEQESKEAVEQARISQEMKKNATPSPSSTPQSIKQQISFRNSPKESSSSREISPVLSASPKIQSNNTSDRISEPFASASTSPARLQSSLSSSRFQPSPRQGFSTPAGTPSKRVQFEPKTPAAPGGWGWTPYQPKIRKDITRTENQVKDIEESREQVVRPLTSPNKGSDEGGGPGLGLKSALKQEPISVLNEISADQIDGEVETRKVFSDERIDDDDEAMVDDGDRIEDNPMMKVVSDSNIASAALERENEEEEVDLEEVCPDVQSVVPEDEYHSISLSPPETQLSEDCSSSQGHPIPSNLPTTPTSSLSNKISQSSMQTPKPQPAPQTPSLKTPAAPGAWGWTPFPFKRRSSTLVTQSPTVPSSLPQLPLPPSTPPKLSSSPRTPSQLKSSPSIDQTSSPLPKRLAFGSPSTTTIPAAANASSTITTTASPSRLRIAHLRAQLNKAEEDEGAARRRVQNARKDWDSVKWVRGKAGDIGPREPRVIRAKVGLWTILGWCAVIAWICFSIARYVYDGYNDPMTSSPFHPALYSPPESSSPLFTASMGLPPGMSAFEVPGQIQTGWNLLLKDWITAEWLKLDPRGGGNV